MNRRSFIKLGLEIGALVVSSPILIERYIVLVNKYRIAIQNLPKEFEGFQIAHVIVCTGDYVRERDNKKEIKAVWPLLNQLEAKEGVFMVLGNHDHWADGDYSRYMLKHSGKSVHHAKGLIHTPKADLFISRGVGWSILPVRFNCYPEIPIIELFRKVS